MRRKDKIITVIYFIGLAIVIWIIVATPSKAQTIEAVSDQLIKVYETELPYEYLSDEARKEIRICFLGNVHEYDMGIDGLFRLAFADDMMFNKVVLLTAYLNLQKNQLIFFYIWQNWLLQIEVSV